MTTTTCQDTVASADTLTISPCNLCPRLCGALRDQGARGVCGADGAIVLARAALHYWEEPVLSGERGSGALFFANCSLGCVYCQNAVLAHGQVGTEISVQRLADICRELAAEGALNINCVTPTHYALAVRDALSLARKDGLDLPVVWNTSGYERVEAVRALSDTVDVYLTDFKYADARLAQRYSHVADYPEVALAALDEMIVQTGAPRYDVVDGQERMLRGIIVRHLLLPGALDASRAALRVLFGRYGNDVRYSIMNQYTPVEFADNFKRFPELASRVPDEDYERLLDYADDLGIEDYFWQEGPAAAESFIPVWDLTGVEG